MKNFIKTIFAVLFGNAIFFGIFIFFLFLAALAIGHSTEEKEVSIKKNSTFLLKIPGELSEMNRKEDPFNIKEDDKNELSIHQLISCIQNASEDSKINSLVISLNYNSDLTYAQIDLLRKAIVDFKKSKKPVFAYGEIVSQKMYYLATTADSIFVNPNGGLDIRGFGAQLTFFKNTIDKLEIEPQIFYAGKFKSATEPLRLNKMSEENKAQTKEFLSDFANIVLPNIAKDRHLSVDALQQSINSLQSMSPMDAKASKLIDGAKYEDEVETSIKSLTKNSSTKNIDFVLPSDYQKEISEESNGDIAVYVAEGNIIDGKSTEGNIGSKTFQQDFRKMAQDDDIKAVVLRINSPGGSSLASSVMLREINLLKSKKPVIVSMGNYAASGGYYIASSGERIFAEPSTITGSIGVFSIIPNFGKMLQNKLGFTFDEIELNEHAVMNTNKLLDPLESQKMQLEVNRIYEEFKHVVSIGRHLTMEQVEAIAQGHVWSGQRALSLKLVDEIGSLPEAIAYASKKAKCDDDYYFYNQKPSFLDELKENFSPSSAMNYLSSMMVKNQLGDQYKYFQMLKNYSQYRGIQAKLPYEIEVY